MADFGRAMKRRSNLPPLEKPLSRVITDDDYLKVLFRFANGTPLLETVRREELNRLAFLRFSQSTPERANALAEAERIHALALMERSIITADMLLKKGVNPTNVMVYHKIARDFAKAYDNRKWGDKVEVAARALIINTNVGGEIDADAAGTVETAGGTFRMSIDEPEAAQQTLLGECEQVSDAADVQQVLQQSNIEVDPGVD